MTVCLAETASRDGKYTALEVRPLKIRNVTSSVRASLGRFKRDEKLYHLKIHNCY